SALFPSRCSTSCTAPGARSVCCEAPRRALDTSGRPRGLFGVGQLSLDEVKPGVPEARVGQVDADDPRQLLGAFRAAGSEQLEVAGNELGAGLLVALIDRQRQQLPVGVGVDVAGAADEVRDVGPPGAVALGQLDRVAEHLGLAVGPQLAEARDRQLALLAPL